MTGVKSGIMKIFEKRKHFFYVLYYLIILFASAVSIVLLTLNLLYKINIVQPPYLFFNVFSLLIFIIDYFVRLYLAKNKSIFFRENIFELLAIVPIHPIFSFFRVFRVFQIGNVFLLIRTAQIFSFSQILLISKNKVKSFFKVTGILYVLIISLLSLSIAALIFSFSEGYSYGNSFWWAMVTATTVGYGGIIPKTIIGRITASILMIVGIGFMGTLTSRLCSFFMNEHSVHRREENKEILKKINEMDSVDKEILKKLDEIKSTNANLTKTIKKMENYMIR